MQVTLYGSFSINPKQPLQFEMLNFNYHFSDQDIKLSMSPYNSLNDVIYGNILINSSSTNNNLVITSLGELLASNGQGIQE